jgi:Zn-dependent M28 family amino/carboxypeptidase
MGTLKHKLIKSAVRVLGTVAVVVFMAWILVAQPSCRRNHTSGTKGDPAKLREHVEALSQRFFPRDWQHRENLDRCADYIAQHFRQAGATVEFQTVDVGKNQYRNVIGRFAAGNGQRIIVGAHYDSCGEEPGADDNASGIASLIELAYLFGRSTPSSPVELVAYVLEEPPFFQSAMMGSAIHAKSIAGDKAGVRGVIVLEMVGTFSDEWGSQSYPAPLLRLIYPSRANFIGVVGRWDQGDWIKTVKTGMKGASDLPVYSIRAPAMIPGVDFSDHASYWPYGIKAVMVTDTAFYRNKAYHKSGDTPDRLDYNRMAKVVVSVFEAIKKELL